MKCKLRLSNITCKGQKCGSGFTSISDKKGCLEKQTAF